MISKGFIFLSVQLFFASFLVAQKTSTEQVHGNPVFTDKKIILQLYQTMKDVHDVLQVKNIPYWVAAGTLLGAVRHQGIIPWDDDLDIRVDEKLRTDFSQLNRTYVLVESSI